MGRHPAEAQPPLVPDVVRASGTPRLAGMNPVSPGNQIQNKCKTNRDPTHDTKICIFIIVGALLAFTLMKIQLTYQNTIMAAIFISGVIYNYSSNLKQSVLCGIITFIAIQYLAVLCLTTMMCIQTEILIKIKDGIK